MAERMKYAAEVHPAYGEIPHKLATTFGLRGFPGKTFILNLHQSYNDQLIIDICDLENGTQENFSRGTLEAILAQAVPAPK
jgi:hypothetical protein